MQNIQLNRLSLSPINVRKTEKDAHIESLASDIESRGLKQNLVVVPAVEVGHFEVIAGGRRLQALQLLATQGKIAPDFDVPCMLDVPEQATETSLAENIQRVAMNPADEYIAFSTIYNQITGTHDEKVAHLAKRFGKSDWAVRQRLRLGQLAEPIIEALRLGQITLEVAMAFGVTASVSRQRAEWSKYKLEDGGLKPNAHAVRQNLTEGAIAGNDRLAIFLGEQAYTAAGGEITRDLFGGPTETIWKNGEIVVDLVTASLKALAEAKQKEEGWEEVRICVTSTSPHWEEVENLHRFQARPTYKPDDACKKAVAELEKELDKLSKALAKCKTDGWPDYKPVDEKMMPKWERSKAIGREIAALREANSVPPFKGKQNGRFIRYLVINDEGKVELYSYWYSVKPIDYDGKLMTASKSKAAEGQSPAQKAGLSNSHVMDLSLQRRDALKGALTGQTDLVVAYGKFVVVDEKIMRLNGQYWGMRGISLKAEDVPNEMAYKIEKNSYMLETTGIDAFAEFQANLDASWFGEWTEGRPVVAEADMATRFRAFCKLPIKLQDGWFQWAVLDLMNPYSYFSENALHAVLGEMASVKIYEWWLPSDVNYWSKLSAGTIEQQLRDCGALDEKATPKFKKGEWVKAAHDVFAGAKELPVGFKTSVKIRQWTPQAMQFQSVKAG